VARRFGLPPLPNTLSLWMGDYTLASDLKEALDLPAEYDLPEDDYSGPLLANLRIPLKEEVRAHLERPGPSIYFAMGSSGNKELYLRALAALGRTEHNVVAVYTTILGGDELPSVGNNVLLEKVVPAEIVNKRVDLAVLHGGQGTFYTAAYSGRPVVGIPMQPEQQYNIDILVRHGSGIRLSKRNFREDALLGAIDKILGDYEKYRTRAEALARRLPMIDGAQRAAERIRAIAIECLGDKKSVPRVE
jgi:UDP:flavonoid glycosyltransferase YjiC (YdhE family)